MRAWWGRHRDGEPPVVAAVAVGGAVGALARMVVLDTWPPGDDRFPFPVLVINVVGSLLLGVLVAVTASYPRYRLLRPFAGTGLLGGFTTYSTFAVEAVLLQAGGHPLAAAGSVVLTPALAVAAAWTGYRTASTALARRPPAAGAA